MRRPNQRLNEGHVLDMLWKAVVKRLCEINAGLAELAAISEVSLVDANYDELGETGHFDEEDVERVKLARRNEPACGFEDNEGQEIEGWLI